MIDETLNQILAIVQRDPNGRGLQTDPHDNLVTATAGDFARACRHIAGFSSPRIAIVTGFTIPTADPPCGETDGPLGALFLARAFTLLGIRVVLASDGTTLAALRAGVDAAGLKDRVPIVDLPDAADEQVFRAEFDRRAGPMDVLIAIERVGPSHSDGRCYSMSGCDITHLTRPAHWLFDFPGSAFTIGIGDGGNEIGMGKIPRVIIAHNISNGDAVACRTRTDELIVAGVSNWGAYALAAGVRLARGIAFDVSLFDPDNERKLLAIMIENGPLIDGLTGQATLSVDGLMMEQYVAPMCEFAHLLS